MVVYIFTIVVIAGAVWLRFGGWARLKNLFFRQRDFCFTCKYCRTDDNGSLFCSLSKCNSVSENTIMDCCEKPKVTEDDLKEVFERSLWNEEGKSYIRQKCLGRRMGWLDVEAFLKTLPNEHPEYLLSDESNRYSSAQKTE